MPHTVVGLIDDEEGLEAAINALLQAGFDRRAIGLIAPEVRSESDRMLSTTRKGLALGAAAAMLFGAAAIVIPGIGGVAVAGAAMALPALGALVGGLAAALEPRGISEKDSHFYAEGVRRGGVLVAVLAQTAEQAARAASLLKENGAANVQQRAAETFGVEHP
jgi:hypothetical protein